MSLVSTIRIFAGSRVDGGWLRSTDRAQSVKTIGFLNTTRPTQLRAQMAAPLLALLLRCNVSRDGTLIIKLLH